MMMVESGVAMGSALLPVVIPGFVAAIGYGPKLLQRIMRFRRFLQLGAAGGERGIAALALEAGYADHAHLVRDCQALAGLPPGQLLGRPITDA